MRKLLILTALVLIVLLAGCGQQVKTVQTGEDAPAAKVTANATVSEPVPPAEAKPTTVTKSDLDKLKADLNDMQFDDIGGIS